VAPYAVGFCGGVVVHPDQMLALAIEQVYAVFARYPPPADREPAPARDGAAILERPSSASLRELTDRQVAGYLGRALAIVGEADHYRHFLPRILELSVGGRGGQLGLTAPSLARGLNQAGWRRWPNAEYVAITTLFVAAWVPVREAPGRRDAGEWLCAIALLGGDIRPLLANWLAPSPSANALVQASWFLMSADVFLGPQSAAPYWADADPDSFGQVLAWMFSASVRRALESGLDQVEADDRWILEKALGAVGGGRH
jgi:hypothetical protein